MEPRIQYTKTSDGVSIAYWTLGEGEPLVFMPPPFSHSQLEWQIDESRYWWEQLATSRRLIRYDQRGYGLSGRDVADFSLEAQLGDLSAVVERVGLESFVLFANFSLGCVALTYAARHPERVSRLILWCCAAHPPSMTPGRFEVLSSLIENDWDLWTDTAAHTLFGWSAGESGQRFAKAMRESVTPEVLSVSMNAASKWDVSDIVPLVASPTLVIQRRGVPFPPLDAGRELTARLPDASLALLEGESMIPYLGDVDSVLDAVSGFLGDESETKDQGESSPGPFRAVLFTDIVGHTEMMSRLGDERGREVLREHERIVREALAEHSGTEVKTMGDGFMASFGSVTKAVECAIAMQRAFAERESDEPLNVRVGINAGEPIEEDGDLFGATVILASRIAAKAEGGEILVADTVRGLCSGKGFLFADRGEFVAKGFEDPVRLFEVRWRE